jgi:hypothetical protein
VEPGWRARAEAWIGQQLGPLGREAAGDIAEVKLRLAEEPDEGWMLQAAGGPTMRSRLDGVNDLGRWERMLGRCAELLPAGAPDRRLAAVTHPFFSMVVATRWLEQNHAVRTGSAEEARLQDAYLAPWAGFGARASLRAALDLALRIGPLTRALGWMRVLEGLPPREQAEWGDHVSRWLRDLATGLERP